ncbi:MAG: sulfite exporter TauE/SafE family protein, partial [Eubacteriales bacterium]
MGAIKSKFLKSPMLEAIIMIAATILSYFGIGVLALVPEDVLTGHMTTASIFLILLAFFLLSVAIAMIAVVAGIGGGVIFTPIMLAFTNVDSVIIRGTGLIVAMFSGLISTGIFIKKGIGNYKLCLVLTISQAAGALAGAILAIGAAQSFGVTGEALMRIVLGVLLLGIGIYLFMGGKKLDYPVIKKIGPVTQKFNLGGQYFEESEGRVRKYEVTRAPLGIILIFLVGVIGGFFGMGGGWAITPVLNMGMGIPLKVAAANSGIILGVGSCVSVWPYIFTGGIIALFVLPWLSGQVVGGFVGSYILAKAKVSIVRVILI